MSATRDTRLERVREEGPPCPRRVIHRGVFLAPNETAPVEVREERVAVERTKAEEETGVELERRVDLQLSQTLSAMSRTYNRSVTYRDDHREGTHGGP